VERSRARAALIAVVIVVIALAAVAWRRSDRADAASAPPPSSSPIIASPTMTMPMTPPPSATSGTANNKLTGPTNIYKAITSKTLAPQVRNDPEYVYVPNGDPGTVEVIDPSTYKVIRRFSFGFHTYPEHVTPSYDLRWLYADVDGASELAQIDPRTGKLHRIIHGIERPYNLYFTPDGKRAIDVAEYDNTLVFMDPHTWKPIRSVKMPCNGSDHADFGPPGTSYLLISCEYDGNIIKVDWKKMQVLRVLNVGGMPIDVKLTPNGKRFLVANQGLGGVSIIDPVTMKQTGFIPTARGAHGMALSRDTTHMYVTDRLAGEISRINLSTLKVDATWNVGGSPDMAQVSPDGSQLWVTNRFGTTVSVISTKTGTVLHHIEVGPDPHGLTYFPEPGRFSLGHNGVYR
jgi:YVTN family beta-propeller protein